MIFLVNSDLLKWRYWAGCFVMVDINKCLFNKRTFGCLCVLFILIKVLVILFVGIVDCFAFITYNFLIKLFGLVVMVIDSFGWFIVRFESFESNFGNYIIFSGSVIESDIVLNQKLKELSLIVFVKFGKLYYRRLIKQKAIFLHIYSNYKNS